MRISGLLIVLLCALVSACAASDSARQSSPLLADANPVSLDWFNSSAITQPDVFSLPASDRRGEDDRFDPRRHGDVTCYTMHIFGMNRESPDSDVTVPDGQWTCQRASKYSVKMVQEPGKAPSR